MKTVDEIMALDEAFVATCGEALAPMSHAGIFRHFFDKGAEAALAQQGEPAWYHAECEDPDYSRFTRDKAEAHAIVSDKGGYVTELFEAAPAAQPVAQPLMPCRCFDDTARRYCRDKNRCTKCEAHGIGAKG